MRNRLLALCVALGGALLVAFMWWARSHDESLARLSSSERAVLVDQTLEHFARVCETSQLATDLQALCADEAALLRRIPECDAGCRGRTAGFTGEHPTR